MSTITQVQGVTPSELSLAFANQVEVIIEKKLKEILAKGNSDDDYLTAKEVQNLLNISHSTMWRKEKANEIPFVRIGRKKLYKRSELIEVLNKG